MNFINKIIAWHSKEECQHTVQVGLHVLITKEENLWSAQGLEIDYAACGTSLEDVKYRFEQGLDRTIKTYLKKCQSIQNLINPAPSDEWVEYMKCASHPHLSMKICQLVPEDNEFSMINHIGFIDKTATA